MPRVLPAERPSPPVYPDPNVRRAADWLAAGTEEGPALLVLGMPYAGGSISRARCDLAPAAVRTALERFTLYSSDFDVSLERLAVLDLGNLPRATAVPVVEAQGHLAEVLRAVRAQTDAPVAVVGGDNSITVGAAQGAGSDALVTFDAHHDVRDYSAGATNGSPVRQLVDGGLAGSRVVQIGIHGFANAPAYVRYVSEAGIATVPAGAVRSRGIDAVVGESLEKLAAEGAARIWVDVDLDCLDRALAPGAPAAMPGGLWPSDLERAAFLLGRSSLVTGLDVTELDPQADVGEATVRTACAVLLAFACGVAVRA